MELDEALAALLQRLRAWGAPIVDALAADEIRGRLWRPRSSPPRPSFFASGVEQLPSYRSSPRLSCIPDDPDSRWLLVWY